MLPLLQALLRIGLLQRGPQSLPASRELAFVIIGAHWLAGLLLSMVGQSSPGGALVSAVVGTLVMITVVQGLLALWRLSGRFYQTVTAMAGCELMVTVVALPFSAWFEVGVAQDLAALFLLVLVGWSLAIAAHIFHHALEVSRFAGYGLALAYLFTSYFVAGLVTAPGA